MKMNRTERVHERRASMPVKFRRAYDKAISGRSRRSAVNIFCAECCGFEIREVHLCTSPECPLYPYRPRSRISQGAPQSLPNRAGLKKTATRASKVGVS